MKKIVVTGGSGKAGRAVVRDLVEHGYEVLNVDMAPSREALAPFLKADLTDMGETFEALHGSEAVVHPAAIPAPGLQTDEVNFRTNNPNTHNGFLASIKIGRNPVVGGPT